MKRLTMASAYTCMFFRTYKLENISEFFQTVLKIRVHGTMDSKTFQKQIATESHFSEKYQELYDFMKFSKLVFDCHA